MALVSVLGVTACGLWATILVVSWLSSLLTRCCRLLLATTLISWLLVLAMLAMLKFPVSTASSVLVTGVLWLISGTLVRTRLFIPVSCVFSPLLGRKAWKRLGANP